MNTRFDPAVLVRTFLDSVAPIAKQLPDLLDLEGLQNSRYIVPARVRGLIAQLAESDREITRASARELGSVTQDHISRGINGSPYENALRQVHLKTEAERSLIHERWYLNLAASDQEAVNNHSLAISGTALTTSFQSAFEGENPEKWERPEFGWLRGSLARLALEYGALLRRFHTRREDRLAREKGRAQWAGYNPLERIDCDQKDATAGLMSRWFRELSPEQASQFDAVIDSRSQRVGGETKHTKPVKRPRTRRSAQKGEARDKIIAALNQHHQYDNGSCGNTAPIKVRELQRTADISSSTASDFFAEKFKGHAEYRAMCIRSASELAMALRMLNGELSPHQLYGGEPKQKRLDGRPSQGERSEAD